MYVCKILKNADIRFEHMTSDIGYLCTGCDETINTEQLNKARSSWHKTVNTLYATPIVGVFISPAPMGAPPLYSTFIHHSAAICPLHELIVPYFFHSGSMSGLQSVTIHNFRLSRFS